MSQYGTPASGYEPPAYQGPSARSNRVRIILLALLGLVILVVLLLLAFCGNGTPPDDAGGSPSPTIGFPTGATPSPSPTGTPTPTVPPTTPPATSTPPRSPSVPVPTEAPDTGGGSTAGSPEVSLVTGGILLLFAAGVMTLIAARRTSRA